MDAGLEQQPMDGDWPPSSPTGGRQDPEQCPKEEEVSSMHCEGETESPNQEAAPGSFIRRFLGAAADQKAGESGNADTPAKKPKSGESGDADSANEEDEGAPDSESGTPDSGQFA